MSSLAREIRIEFTPEQQAEVNRLSGIAMPCWSATAVQVAALALAGRRAGGETLPYGRRAIEATLRPESRHDVAPDAMLRITLTREQRTAIFEATGLSVSTLVMAADDLPISYRESRGAGPESLRVGAGAFIIIADQDGPEYDRNRVIRIPSCGEGTRWVFGTGRHPTTRLALILLEKYVKAGGRVLDVGTGSGILAVAALKLGAEGALGVDPDVEAIACARRTAEANGLADRLRFREGSVPVCGDRYHTVVANLFAGPLIELARALAESMTEDAHLITSGIVLNRERDVVEAMRVADLELIDRSTEDNWVGFVFRKRPHEPST